MILGQEDVSPTAKRFDSRENPVAANRPKLVIEFSAGNSNSAPTMINLSENRVPERAVEAVVGNLSVDDVDVGDTHDFVVSDGRFEVVQNQLRLKEDQRLSSIEEHSIEISVTATDSGVPALSVTTDFTIEVVPLENEFQNPLRQFDVNADGIVAPIDVLLIINFINGRPGDSSVPPPSFEIPLVNVDGDDKIAPLDVLLVINLLNSNIGSEGETDKTRITSQPPADVTLQNKWAASLPLATVKHPMLHWLFRA